MLGLIRHGWYSQMAILVEFWSMTLKVLAGLIGKRTTICSNFPPTEDIEEEKRLTSFHQPGWFDDQAKLYIRFQKRWLGRPVATKLC